MSALLRFPRVREALDAKSNATVHKFCKKWDVPVIEINSRSKAVPAADFERALARATGKDT